MRETGLADGACRSSCNCKIEHVQIWLCARNQACMDLAMRAEPGMCRSLCACLMRGSICLQNYVLFCVCGCSCTHKTERAHPCIDLAMCAKLGAHAYACRSGRTCKTECVDLSICRFVHTSSHTHAQDLATQALADLATCISGRARSRN